ncbi:unnamed protein product [Periconia digitata]|uniref:Uncharacterized protein n=1 Tax=Periconia digitata TaxID=1303443 RepID=A0A9W4XG89_9PLEO|nr:unnamed protein product [Periconia digitata]
MSLLKLSSELLHEILLYAVHSRGVARAMRLSLVCKKFKIHLPRAVFESRILDDHFTKGLYNALMPTQSWQIRKDHGGVRFWHSYYVFRVRIETVQNGTDPRTGRYVEMRQIATEFSRWTQVSVEETIDALCWLALEKWRDTFRKWDKKDVTSDFGLNLLSAAAYFDSMPLARQLLAQGHDPTNDNDLFPSPMEIAAWAGNGDMLRLFQDSVPEFEYSQPRSSGDIRSWRGQVGPGSVKGAALKGDIDMLKLAVSPASQSGPKFDSARRPIKKFRLKAIQRSALWATLRYCKTPETFEHIISLMGSRLFDKESLLAHYAALGNVNMVRHLLDAGAQWQGENNCNPLQIAAHYSHEDVVDLLIDRGIDLGDSEGQARGTPLMAAASSGCMSLVRKFVDAGARIAEDEELGIAIYLEHTEMANYFMDLYSSHPKSWWRHLAAAEEDGLESMVDLLRARGVTLPP